VKTPRQEYFCTTKERTIREKNTIVIVSIAISKDSEDDKKCFGPIEVGAEEGRRRTYIVKVQWRYFRGIEMERRDRYGLHQKQTADPM